MQFIARGVFLALVAAVAHAQGVAMSRGASPPAPGAPLAASANLIVNGGADEQLVDGELPGWTEVKGGQWTAHTDNPQAGWAKFYSGNVEEGELSQDIDVSDYVPFIEAGLQAFSFTGYVRSYAQDNPSTDSSRVIVEYHNLFGKVVDSYDSDELAISGVWWPLTNTCFPPPDTRWIRVRLLTKRYTGTSNDAWFDTLSLVALEPTPWADLGAGLAGGAGAPALVGSGTLVAGSAGTLELANAPSLALTSLFISLASVPMPFKGGTLSAVPVSVLLPVPTYFNGKWMLGWDSWPAGFSAGTQLYFQVVVPDDGAPQSFAISNLVRATMP